MANITDVAKLAGVSPSTVSKYLNNPEAMRPANAAAVKSAIEKLQYTPNLLARNLRVNNSRTIAVIAQEITNPFHATVYNTIRKEAQKRNYSVVLYSVNDVDGDIASRFGAVPVNYFSGFVCCYLIDMPQSYAFAMQNADVPSVVLSNDLHLSEAHPATASVFIDIKTGFCSAVEHLIGLGMRDIAFLGSITRHPELEPKLTGFMETMRQHGLEPSRIFNARQEFSVTTGYQLAEKLLRAEPLPQAIMVDSDIMAMGVMRCLADHGLQVPKDVLMTSCDDTMLSSVYCPAFTTVRLPIEEACRKACQMLLDQIKKRPAEAGIPQFDTELIVRETTTC